MPVMAIESGAAAPSTPRRRAWRRRRYVVDVRYQLRMGILVGAVAAALLVLLNASILMERRSASASTDASWTLILLGSAVFLGGAILVGVVASHRTAGAAFAIRRSVDELSAGKIGVRVRLRRGDELQDLASAVNRLAEELDRERASRA